MPINRSPTDHHSIPMACTICSIMGISTPAISRISVVPLRFSAGVLAGGRSTRMGTDKSFLRVGGELLIERQLRYLREVGAVELLISGRGGVDYSSLRADVIYDQQADSGPLAGLAALLKASSCSMMLILAVDMPGILPVMLNKILSRCTDNLGCVPVDDHGLQPLAAAYPTIAYSLAERCLRNGELSVQAFANQAFEQGLVQSLRIELSERIYFTNWNQPSDWIAGPCG